MTFARVQLVVILLACTAAQGAPSSEQNLNAVAFDQKVGRSLPEGVSFKNRNGEDVALSTLAGEKPLVLVMSWFECPNLCPMLLDNLAESAKKLPFGNDRYNVAAI
ncbi:MAG TPA: hypothetical protein VIN33_09710, partial [Marinobacter sp.]